MSTTTKFSALALSVALALAACSQKPAPPVPAEAEATTSPVAEAAFPAGEWQLISSEEGDGLFFGAAEGEPATVHLFCPSGGGLLVNVNVLKPVGSEDRMSLGSGATVVALVADPAGDANRGGVSGEGTVPPSLADILTGAQGVSMAYGAQGVGPLPPVPAATARDFVAGCTG